MCEVVHKTGVRCIWKKQKTFCYCNRHKLIQKKEETDINNIHNTKFVFDSNYKTEEPQVVEEKPKRKYKKKVKEVEEVEEVEYLPFNSLN